MTLIVLPMRLGHGAVPDDRRHELCNPEMEVMMNRWKLLTRSFGASAALVALLSLPLSVLGATFEGKLNGHDCAERGTTCPVDRLDPHLVLEADFVLQEANGEYYFLVNVPRDVKVRHALKAVSVTGDVNRKYNAITVDKLMVGGKTIWTQKLADDERQHHLYPGALTGN